MLSASNQFSVAIHILCFLEFNKNGRTTSELLGMSAGANPAVIRRIMRKLSQAGLIVASLGVNANITLARAAAEVSLLDVYCAISDGERKELFMLHPEPHPQCPVGSKIPFVLPSVYDQIQTVMETELSRVTIAELVHRMGNLPIQAADFDS